MTTTTRPDGHDAIRYATANGLTLSTYSDPTAERMAYLIRGAEAGDPATAEGIAAGHFACHWTDAEIEALASEMGIAAPLDCDAIRALVEALDREEAALDAANREDA